MEISGREAQRKIFTELENNIIHLHRTKQIYPCLGIVLVGQRKDSQTYVRMKKKACDKLNIVYEEFLFDEDISEKKLLACVKSLNKNNNIHGVLIQLPLPEGINENKVINTLSADKDIEGMTDINMGKMLRGEKGFYNCTPVGCIRLLDEYNIPIEGADIALLGCGNVGLPLSILLIKRGATVITCHDKTKNIADKCRNADIIISCVGKANLITEDHIGKHSIVIDVGINHNEGKIEGDMPHDLKKKVKMATPVPGGVGPMTIGILLYNLVKKTMIQHELLDWKDIL